MEKVFTPAPVGRWHPIAHIDLHHCIERAVAALNLRIVAQVHALARKGNHYFGMYQVVNGHDNNEMGLVLGTRNSHDKMFVAGLAAGDGVFCCDNLSFWSEVVLSRVHTTNIVRDLPLICNKAVGMLADKWTDMESRIIAYKAHALSDEQAHDFIIRAVDAGALTTTGIPTVLKEWRMPSYAEFSADGRNAWRRLFRILHLRIAARFYGSLRFSGKESCRRLQLWLVFSRHGARSHYRGAQRSANNESNQAARRVTLSHCSACSGRLRDAGFNVLQAA